jgi:hypothetical protein
MEILFKTLLVIHVIAGSIGLFTGTMNIVRRKGDILHKKVGILFYFGMLINAVAGFVMSIMHENLFLLIIAVFSFYLTATGKRFLNLKRLNDEQKPKKIDWLLTLTMFLFSIFFILYGINLLIHLVDFGIVLLFFGLISILMVRNDLKIYSGKIKFENYWLLIHIQRMIAGYIAALTAFLVVNNTYLPSIVAWLLPTVIFTPLIFYWSKKNAVKKINLKTKS